MKSENYGITKLHGLVDTQNLHTAPELQGILESLDHIKKVLEREIDCKQVLIDKQLSDIRELKAELGKSRAEAAGLQRQLEECSQHAEGNRQLINKLLNDISQYQNNIEWYKRTYEKRSFWGILKDRLGKRR